MNPVESFLEDRKRNIAAIRESDHLSELSNEWIREVSAFKYIFNFDWLGRPIIQIGSDMVAVQEAIWRTRPDLIIETGIAHGGSLVYHASLLAMLDLCDAAVNGEVVDPRRPKRRVLGIDIDIRSHNREAIEAHPLRGYLEMFEGSSIDPAMVARVADFAKGFGRVMVVLDSNHTESHVLAELEAYAPLVSPGGYCIVFDTAIENMPEDFYNDRPWGRGDNPMTAVWKYLESNPEFAIDGELDGKILIGNAPNGFLRRCPATEA
jgi:cephalosporin hydroxylase